MPNQTTHNLFDDQVTVIFSGTHSLGKDVVIAEMRQAFPEYESMPDNAGGAIGLKEALTFYMLVIPSILHVKFDLKEDAHIALKRFEMFWKQWETSMNYKYLFRLLMGCLDVDLYAALWTAYTQSEPTRLMAPAEMRLPEEALDPEA